MALEKTERLLDLVAFLLDAREPVSWAEIREAFPEDYGKGSEESCNRKFERDKAELAELGIGLEYQPRSDELKEGYVLSPESYYLPEIGLTPEETAVLYAAGSAAMAAGAFPGRADLGHALRKIGFVNGEGAPSPTRVFADLGRAEEGLAGHLEALWQALAARKRVTLRYRGLGRDEETERVVEPYGLCLRRGAWVLAGYCHLRKAQRTFQVDRILSVTVNRERPKSPDYDVPADFRVAAFAAEQVWEHRFHPPMEVRIRLSSELAPLAGRLFPNAKAAGEENVVCVTAWYLDGLLRRVLPLGEGAVVVGPEAAVARARELLESVMNAHAVEGA